MHVWSQNDHFKTGTNQTIDAITSQSTKELPAQPIQARGTIRWLSNYFTEGQTREYSRGKSHCTVDLLFDWFEISCMTTDNYCFYLKNRPIQTSQTGGQWYNDTSPFSIPWPNILGTAWAWSSLVLWEVAGSLSRYGTVQEQSSYLTRIMQVCNQIDHFKTGTNSTSDVITSQSTKELPNLT